MRTSTTATSPFSTTATADTTFAAIEGCRVLGAVCRLRLGIWISIVLGLWIVRCVRFIFPGSETNAGWIVGNSGEEICLFSSDFPHVEGGRNPVKRFDESLAALSPRTIERFYCDNFIDLMGEGLAPDLRRPAIRSAA